MSNFCLNTAKLWNVCALPRGVGFVLREVCRRSRIRESREVRRRLRDRDLFAPFLNANKTVCTRMYACVLVYKRLCSDEIIMYQCMLGKPESRIHRYIPVCTGINQYTLHTCHDSHVTVQYVLVHNSMNWYRQLHNSY